MAHFAQIDEYNIVTQVQVIDNEAIGGGEFPSSEALGQQFQADHQIPGTWLQCSYSGSFRGAYPGQGWTWTPNKKRKDGGIFEPPVVPVAEPTPEVAP